jgi:hypothetical protein
MAHSYLVMVVVVLLLRMVMMTMLEPCLCCTGAQHGPGHDARHQGSMIEGMDLDGN